MKDMKRIATSSRISQIVCIDGVSVFGANLDRGSGTDARILEHWIPVFPGTYRVTVQAHEEAGATFSKSLNVTVTGPNSCKPNPPTSALNVTVCSPHDGSTVSSPVHVDDTTGNPTTILQIYVDGLKRYQNYRSTVDTN